MNICTISVDLNIYINDGAPVDAALFDAIARDWAGDFDELRNAVRVVVRRFCVRVLGETSPRFFDSFFALTSFLHGARVSSVYCYDGEEFFSILEWCIKRDPREWRRVTKADQKRVDGTYNKVTGNAYCELSGTLGQRYSFGIWTEGKDDHRRVVTRGTQFYAFKNVMDKGLSVAASSLGVGVSTLECDTLRDVLVAFDSLCVAQFGTSYFGEKKPLAMTAGSLARLDLFASMYGKKTPQANARAFSRDHAVVRAGCGWLRARKFLRGGICCGNPEIWNKRLGEMPDGRRLVKYDVRSEYTRVAYDLGVPVSATAVDAKELNKRRDGYIYIIVTDTLILSRRRGMPPVFTNPFTQRATDNVTIRQEFAIPAEELDELEYFYKIEECTIKHVIAVELKQNDGVREYCKKWYSLKETAKKDGRVGLASLAKMMCNAAWGQLAKKSAFPECTHVYDDASLSFKLKIDYTEEETGEDCGKYNLLWGGLITSGGRVYIMRKIREICGNRNALSTFCYTDTDSVHAYADAPSDLVGDKCGQLKRELVAIESKYIAKKVYYNAESLSPLRVEMHARGVHVGEILSALKENYGTDDPSELPLDAFADAFSVGIAYPTPALLQVDGGRVHMYVKKMLSADGDIITTNSRGATFAIDESGNLTEL